MLHAALDSLEFWVEYVFQQGVIRGAQPVESIYG